MHACMHVLPLGKEQVTLLPASWNMQSQASRRHDLQHRKRKWQDMTGAPTYHCHHGKNDLCQESWLTYIYIYG